MTNPENIEHYDDTEDLNRILDVTAETAPHEHGADCQKATLDIQVVPFGRMLPRLVLVGGTGEEPRLTVVADFDPREDGSLHIDLMAGGIPTDVHGLEILADALHDMAHMVMRRAKTGAGPDYHAAPDAPHTPANPATPTTDHE